MGAKPNVRYPAPPARPRSDIVWKESASEAALKGNGGSCSGERAAQQPDA
jgi:hypothetical protein